MTLLFDGQNAFFAERGKTFAKRLVIHVPKDAALFVGNVCYFPQDGNVELPLSSLRHGTTPLALRFGNRIFPTESLFFDGEALSPAGLSTEALLLRQNERLTTLSDQLALLAGRVEQLERQNTARMLFS